MKTSLLPYHQLFHHLGVRCGQSYETAEEMLKKAGLKRSSTAAGLAFKSKDNDRNPQIEILDYGSWRGGQPTWKVEDGENLTFEIQTSNMHDTADVMKGLGFKGEEGLLRLRERNSPIIRLVRGHDTQFHLGLFFKDSRAFRRFLDKLPQWPDFTAYVKAMKGNTAEDPDFRHGSVGPVAIEAMIGERGLNLHNHI